MENKNMKNYIKPTYVKEELMTTDIMLLSASNGTNLEKGSQDGMGVVSAAMSYILGY